MIDKVSRSKYGNGGVIKNISSQKPRTLKHFMIIGMIEKKNNKETLSLIPALLPSFCMGVLEDETRVHVVQVLVAWMT